MALSYAGDIRPLFREMDVEEMKMNGPFDLSQYDDVKKRASDIFQRLSDGDMPCDAAWSADNVRKFKDWMEGGMNP
ncbi:MAG: hypothetical protein HY070_06495 [Chloroflexi bacterium]|nr:hypothetical protein [Chloroflexota bacterium]MBI3742559.1 hypothetical protein [Chloroflexota bacterium]